MKAQNGILARTGEKCPETGLWKVSEDSLSIKINQGNIIPAYNGKNTSWELVMKDTED